MTWIWLGLIVTLTLIELLTKNIVTIWYIGSAIISLILSLFIDSFLTEFLLFVIMGTILLFTTRDYLIKKINEIKSKRVGKK